MAKTLLIIYFWKTDWELFKGNLFLFFKDFIYFIFRERGKEREREGEKHQYVVAPNGDLAGYPGMHPDWESNRQPRSLHSLALSSLSQPARAKSSF